MPGLVIGYDLLFLLADHTALALGAGDYAINRLVELRHLDFLLTAPRGQNSALVDKVSQVRAGEAGRLFCQRLQADVAVQRLALGVHLKDRLAAADVGLVEDNLAVESPGRRSAGSRISGRLVAATTMTFVFVSNPS